MTGRFARMTVALVLALGLALSACGRKGSLHPPEGEEGAYTGPGVYPAPESVVPQGGEASAVPADEEEPEESGAEGASAP